MRKHKEGNKKNVHKEIASLQLHHRRTLAERFADWCTEFFGTAHFLLLHVLIFGVWIVVNAGVIPGVPRLDPYPFNFLTTTVSLEAIFLSIVVLMSQNREERIANIRDEIDLQINVQSEREITKMLEMLATIEKRLHVAPKVDPELLAMLRKIDIDQLEARIVQTIEKSSQ